MRTAAVPTRAAVMAQAPAENFPVASWLLGRRTRGHLLALYGFARLVDDIGDEELDDAAAARSGEPGWRAGGLAAGDRLALLDWAEQDLDRVFAGARPEHAVMHALAPTVRACALPREPFARLIEANRRDQTVTRYETFDELLGYCQLSAAPVGELVLHVFGAATPDRIALSDRICAGLQVTEHLQDLAEDRARGRVYLPDDLAGPAGIARARVLLDEGAPLVGRLRGRARLAVAGFVAGGRAALAGLERGERRHAFATTFLRTAVGR